MGLRTANRKVLVERFHGMEEVRGSIPLSSTPKPLEIGAFVISGCLRSIDICYVRSYGSRTTIGCFVRHRGRGGWLWVVRRG